MMQQVAAAIDIGGTNTLIGFVNEAGKILARDSVKTTEYPEPKELVNAVAKRISEHLTENFKLTGIGIGAPNGNYYNGTIEFAPNLKWKGVVPLAKLFKEKMNVEAVLTNDANAAALGEMYFGGAKKMKDFLFITLGTGLGNNLTYKAVIENLNILDYDYYFKVTDDILIGNISSVLLTFNEIINNGFDGHNFINGLASHFRDLLVCKDEATLKLLEVSPSIREKYKVQSKDSAANFLLELLELTSKCDIGYRASKNQRLHVELTLLKMCSLNIGTSSYQDIFKKKVDAIPTIKVITKETVIAKTEEPKILSPISEPSIVREPEQPWLLQKEKQKQDVTLRSSISISANLNQKNSTVAANFKKEEVSETAIINTFSDADLENALSEYSNILEQQGRMTLAAAITKRKPEMKENFLVSFGLDNATLEKDLNDIKMELMTFIRNKLNNNQVQLITFVDKDNSMVSKIPYTPKEKFEYMAAKNPLLLELKKQLDLEVEY